MNQSWFFEKINKIDKPLYKLAKRHTETIQSNTIRDEMQNTTNNKKILRPHFFSYLFNFIYLFFSHTISPNHSHKDML